MFKRILVGFDGSAPSVEALRTAVLLAGRLGGEVAVVEVVPRGGAPRADGSGEATIAEAARSGVRCSLEVVEGPRPSEVLASHLVEHGYDLLVVGRQGNGAEEAQHAGAGTPQRGQRERPGRDLGSVARQLVEKATFPVLVVGAPASGG